MKNYLLDTNILIHIVRQSSTWAQVQARYTPFAHHVMIAFASVAEILSIATQLGWGLKKQMLLEAILAKITIVTHDESINNSYVDIDVFSQGKHQNLPLPQGLSARNMGKNDIWIAACTHQAHAQLITTDQDFNHLNDTFFPVHCVLPL